MGPFVPDIISDNLNLIVGFLIGIAFGYVLEQAGFSSSKKLTGLFYGTDFTVLRVFFTAGVTAMSGVILLGYFGLLDLDIIYINPTFLYSALAGGAIMGIGFVVGGYCPGTSLCGAAIGKIDAMVFVAGGLLGVLSFGEIYPFVQNFYLSGSYGDITIFSALGMSQGLFALLLIAGAILAFIVTTKIEKLVNPSSGAKSFPVRYHRLAATGLLGLGIVLAALPDYKVRLLEKAQAEAAGNVHPAKLMSPDELAFRIIDRDPALQIIDVRDGAEYSKMTLPGAVNIPMKEMFGKAWRDVLGQAQKKKVLIANNEAEGVRAAHLAGLLGYENLLALQGGLDDFTKTIINPQPAANISGHGEGDVYRFRQKAGPLITQMIKEQKAPRNAERQAKKIVGGCGT